MKHIIHIFISLFFVSLHAGNNNITIECFSPRKESTSELYKLPTQNYFKVIRDKDFVEKIEPIRGNHEHKEISIHDHDRNYILDVVTDMALKYLKQYIGVESSGLYEDIKESVKCRVKQKISYVVGIDPLILESKHLVEIKKRIHVIISQVIQDRIRIQDNAISCKSLEIEKQKRELAHNYKKSKLLVVGNFATALVSVIVTATVGLIVHFTGGE